MLCYLVIFEPLCSLKPITMDNNTPGKNPVYSKTAADKVTLKNEEWAKLLPKDVYEIARRKGTERPFTGQYWNSNEGGTYYCAACGNPLFTSDAKFDSSCG